MKKIFFMIIILISGITAQEKNKQIVDEKSGKQMLIGCCDRTAFADTSYSWWFNSEYDSYTPLMEVVEKLKPIISNTAITVIMGSWCSDSRREIPRLYKILDQVNYNFNSLNLINVDRNKKSPDTNLENYDIKLVPTIIIFREGKEIGRIIESPKEKLEEDLAEIITAN